MEGSKRYNLRPRPSTATNRGTHGASSSGSGGKRREEERANTVKKLQRREIGERSRAALAIPSDAPENFRDLQLQEEFDTYDDSINQFLKLQFLTRRSKIIEIAAAKDIIIALAESGLCAAFSRTTNKRICFLNMSPDEVIRSLYYNKNDESLITVSIYASDYFSSMTCRTTAIEYIRRNQLDAGIPLFENQSIKRPGFVEFDNVNEKLLTYTDRDRIYKVYDLKNNYSFLYALSDSNIEEIKISPGILLLVMRRTPGYVPLKILSAEDGTELKFFSHRIHRHKKIDFIMQFSEKLLMKQENEGLHILDVRTLKSVKISRNEFRMPSAFIFLNRIQHFLTFRNGKAELWNFKGEQLTKFEDHELWNEEYTANNIYVTANQDFMISYCKAKGAEDEDEASAIGSINISNIQSGRCIAKISPSNPNIKVSPRRADDRNRSLVRSTIREALEDVSTVFYNEDRNEIYSGNNQGLIHVWSR